MEILKNDDGKTLLYFLYGQLGLSVGEVKRLKKRDGILINGRPVTVRYVLKEGDVIELSKEERRSESIPPCDIPLDIIYEDEDVLAVNKPSGLAVHPSAGNREITLAGGVMNYYKDQSFVFRAVGRLDKYTSGIVVIAKNADSAFKLGRQFRKETVKKTYFGLAESSPCPPNGEISAPIRRQEGSVIKREVSPLGKPAVTRYETVEQRKDGTLLKLYPLTGRTHQIRVHLAYIGCPLKYVFLYGTEKEGKHFLLHCGELEIIKNDGKRLLLCAPCPF